MNLSFRSWLRLLVPLLLCGSLVAPALALDDVADLKILAKVAPTGAVIVSELRQLTDPRPVEFLEILLPPDVQVQGVTISDSQGPFRPSQDPAPVTDTLPTPGGASDRTFRMERTGEVLYLEWQEANPTADTYTINYVLTNGLIMHQDAVEWYFPAVAGSRDRGVKSLYAIIELPQAGEANLYAYGGGAGGVRVAPNRFTLSASNLQPERPFEWRLLMDRAMLPDAQGRPGTSFLANLRLAEEQRIQAEMSRSTTAWVTSWLLLLSIPALGWLYWRQARRHNPFPRPDSLSPAERTSVTPAVLGWVYSTGWFDIATAQLLYLERHGVIRAEWNDEGELSFQRAGGQVLDLADERLLALFGITPGPITVAQIGQLWASEGRHWESWLQAVGKQVPPEWLDRPSAISGALFATVTGVGALAALIVDNGLVGIPLIAVAALAFVVIRKRRWLSALGESHVTAGIQLYYKAVNASKHEAEELASQIPGEYALAVEVGDRPLKYLLGAERYRMIEALYEELEEE